MLLAAVAGAVLGSFLATLVVRWPEGRGLGGRSACDGCGRTLRAVELIPLASYLFGKGRCRTCGTAIDRVHPSMEAASAVLTGLAFAVLPITQAPWIAAASLLLLTLAVLDLRHFWLPDPLTLPLGVLGLLASLSGPPGLGERAIAGVVGWASLALIAWGYRRLRGRVGLGAGDPKLFGAIGAWAGAATAYVMLGASVLGLAVALLLLASGRRITATTRMPFGTLLAIAALPAIYWTALA